MALNQSERKSLLDNAERLRNLQSGTSGNRAKVLGQVADSLTSLAGEEVPDTSGSPEPSAGKAGGSSGKP